jgi:transketolase C-terminal domain/subunit
VSNSTFSALAAAHLKLFEAKIAEKNMVSTASGLSAAGSSLRQHVREIPLARRRQTRWPISAANIGCRLARGISLAADGPSQWACSTCLFRLRHLRDDDRESPLCWSFHPADAVAHITARA